MSIFDSCSDSCGWVAALTAAVAYGSFGVPIRAIPANIPVHPLVMQSYKTLVLFLSSWLVIWMGEQARYTPWGFLSGLLWVSGGACGIYAIRNAGLSIAVGVWASVMVLVSFVWGILVFSEPIHDILGTFVAFFLLGIGLVGMSRFSAPSLSNKKHVGGGQEEGVDHHGAEYELGTKMDNHQSGEDRISSSGFQKMLSEDTDNSIEDSRSNNNKMVVVIVAGRPLAVTQRQLGIVAAVGNGVLTGSSLVPVHYAKDHGFGGATYMISFAIGSLVANIMLWVLFFLYELSRASGGLTPAYEAMPAWHFRKLWLPGFVSGFLLSIAMFCSILAVTYLGQGVGFSVIQSKILISGLWGIFVFQEIRARDAVIMWFISAAVATIGILLMSLEREGAVPADGEE